jgi:N6-adenosine-specific RNA methylase IME4
MTTMLVADIKIEKRHRADLGDIDGLAASIERIGLLHPVVVKPDGTLIAGQRRILAWRKLGRAEFEMIPVTIVDLEKIVLGEYAENTDRKDFTYAEAVAILREVRPHEEKAAKERQRAAGAASKGKPRGTALGKLPQAVKGAAADKAAKATGKRRRTLEKAEAVVVKAEQDPQGYGDLADRLKEDDAKVDAIHREMKQREARADYEARADKGARVGDLVEMAKAGQRFAVIYADPAWTFETYSGRGKQRSAERHYDTASLDDIKALPVGPLAAENCALFLWGVWPELPGAFEVIKAWGFEYKTAAFVWIKTTPNANAISLDGGGLHWGMGYHTRANSEPVLLATRGNPFRLEEDVHQVIFAPVDEHSVKPEEVRRRIERLLVGPYLELFARRPVPGWTVWGNELERLVTEAAE